MPATIGTYQSGALPAPTQVAAPSVCKVKDTVRTTGVEMDMSSRCKVQALLAAPAAALANKASAPLM